MWLCTSGPAWFATRTIAWRVKGRRLTGRGSSFQHCDLCYETDFGSRCGRRFSGYGDAMDIMRHMTQLEHIRRRDERQAAERKEK